MTKKQTNKSRPQKTYLNFPRPYKSRKLHREMTKSEVDELLFNTFFLFTAIDDRDRGSVNLKDPLHAKYVDAIEEGLDIYFRTRIL